MNLERVSSPMPTLTPRVPDQVQRKADPLAGQVLADGLRVSAPSDPLEREAEATADRVMRTPTPQGGAVGQVQRAYAACSDSGTKGRETQRQVASVYRAPASIASQGGPGSALSDGVRSDLEGRFGGQDFSRVRVHTGPQAVGLARSFNARAFTMGSDIYFGQGEYSPSSRGGQRLLAHELTHVVQAGQAGMQRQAAPGIMRQVTEAGVKSKIIAFVEQRFQGNSQQAFQTYAGQDGQLSREDLLRFLDDAGVTFKDAVASKIIRRYDTNHDGSISLDELQSALRAVPR